MMVVLDCFLLYLFDRPRPVSFPREEQEEEEEEKIGRFSLINSIMMTPLLLP